MIDNQSNFLKEENRNGYFVSTNMKKIWLKQLKMLNVITTICDKYNIKYFAVCGTLIGAIRENGFIPWDDDIDIGMTRENAIKFMQVAKDEVPEDYCLVGLNFTKKLFRPHLQLREKNTTCLVKADYKLKYCKGLWVDIFIFDKFPFNDYENKKFRAKLSKLNKILHYYTFHRLSSQNSLKRFVKLFLVRFYVVLHGGFNRLNNYYNNYCMKFNELKDNYYYDYLSFKPYRILKIPFDTFDELIDHVFEFTTIKIPAKYNQALEPEYGNDYMIRKKMQTGHGDIFVDLNKSYLEYENLSKKKFNELFKN